MSPTFPTSGLSVRTGSPMAAVLAAMVAAVLVLVAVDPVLAQSATDDDGALVHGSYTYVLDLDDTEVDVFVDVNIEATRADEQTAEGVFQYFLTRYQMVVPSAATELAVGDNQGALDPTREGFDVDGFDLVTVDLRRNLFLGQSTVLSVSYSLDDDLANFQLDSAETAVIVNPASAGWFVFTDGGLDSWDVTIEAPAGFEPVVNPAYPPPFQPQGAGDDGSLILGGSGEGEGAFAFVLLERDEGMVETSAQGPGVDIVLRHWPGDETWLSQVSNEIDTNLPKLVDLVGTPWPDRPLTIQESAVPLGSSYAGWYIAEDNLIVVGPRINNLTVMHELAHVWLNHETLGDRWVIEGLASEFAALAVADRSADGSIDPASVEEAPAASLDDDEAHPLSAWDSYDPEVESWDYDASWRLVRDIRTEVGLDAFLTAVRAAVAGEPPYAGPRPISSEDSSGSSLLRYRFVDYVEEASPGITVAPLVADWADGGWSEAYEARAQARERYGSLADDALGWEPPLVVRNAMSRWQFDAAEEAMAVAENVMVERDAVVDDLDADLGLPAGFDRRYALAEDSGQLLALSEELRAAADSLGDLDGLESGAGFLEQVGLVGSDLDHHRQLARALYTTGQFEQMDEAAAEARSDVEGAQSRGAIRLAVAAAALGALGLVAVGRRRRRSALG